MLSAISLKRNVVNRADAASGHAMVIFWSR